jgi:hypothetical protein
VLNLPKGFTLEQLRYNYRVLARQLHPDKSGGRLTREQATAAFQVLTSAYKTLLVEHTENPPGGRDAHELKAAFDAAMRAGGSGGSSTPPVSRPARVDPEKFDAGRFNAVFDEVRAPDPVADDGYAEWMARNDPGSASAGCGDTGRGRELSSFVVPQAAAMRCTAARRVGLGFVELGASCVDDFSARLRQLECTDYKAAHTARLVDDTRAARHEYASIEDLKRDRSSVAFEMTDADLQSAEEARRAEEAREARRLEALRRHDASVAQRYARAHAMLLGG